MNVVILHCHFERGGVTQVVENHVAYLTEHSPVSRIVLVSGSRVSGLSEPTRQAVTFVTLEELDYDHTLYRPGENKQRADPVARQLASALAAQGLSPSDTVLHWHNHSLGKNVAIPVVIERLADDGWRQLLQIHDFAEDHRPENYQRLLTASGASDKSEIDDFLYPRHKGIQFSALTQVDVCVLRGLGRPAHLLFNSVELSVDQLPDHETAITKIRQAFDLPADVRYTLYPVRGIRRKNVGEWLLLTRMLPADAVSGLTLMPTTPVERDSYLRWRSFASQHAPRAVFDVGHHQDVSFLDNLAAADKVLSSSVAEGFGMTFLEPWLVGREVIARRLPGVTDDFIAAGVKLPKLYDSIPIPGSSSWIAQCRAETAARMEDAARQIPAAFRPPHDGAIDDHRQIDFARLTPQRQSEVLRRMATDAGFEQEVLARSAKLVSDLAAPTDPPLIASNRHAVQSDYSIAAVGQRLLEIYDRTLGGDHQATDGSRTETPAESANAAIDLVNQNRSFFPCRTETFGDD